MSSPLQPRAGNYACWAAFSILLCLYSPPAEAQPFSDSLFIDESIDGVQEIVTDDIDGDGDRDVISSSSIDDVIKWYENESGDGSTWKSRVVSSLSLASGVSTADIDGDGDADIVGKGGSTIQWYENTSGDGSAWTTHDIVTGFDRGDRGVHATDVDGDGDTDVVFAERPDDTVAWYENTGGDGTAWTLHEITASATNAWDVHAADVDDDGDTDVLAASSEDHRIAWHENTSGDGSSWRSRTIFTYSSDARDVFPVDIDQDGDTDVLSASVGDDKVVWHENTAGDGTAWNSHIIDSTVDGARSVFGADIDGDGDTDVLSSAILDDTIIWHENTLGDGSTWNSHTISTSAYFSVSVVATDVDGDQDTDVLSSSYDGDSVEWYENFAPTATLDGIAGNEGDANEYTTGGDAGWVLMAPPEGGATFESLSHSTDDQMIEFGLEGPMIYTYDAATDSWDEVTSAESGNTLNSGEGFLLYVFDDEGSPDADPVDPSLTVQFNGTGPITSDVTRSNLGTGDQWVFLGHPYNKQPLDLTQLTASGNGQSMSAYSTTVQIYDRSRGTWDPGFTLDPGVDTGDESTVRMGQGFFLECTDYQNENCPSQVTLPTAAQKSGGREDIVGYSKSNPPSQQARLALSMIVESNDDTVATDKAAEILFAEEATSGWDRYDATKLAPLRSQYATISPLSPAGDTTRAAAQASLPWPDSSRTFEVPLAVTPVGVAGQATLTANEAMSLPPDWTATLIDTKGTADPGDDEEVPWTSDASYQFMIGSDGSNASAKSFSKEGVRTTPNRPGPLELEKQSAWKAQHGSRRKSETPPRLLLHVESSSSIPVELASFEAKESKEREVQLTWQTASETNNAGFTIERKISGRTVSEWTTVGFREGSGTTSEQRRYRFTDREIPFGIEQVTYRLRQEDLDGTTSYSDPTTVQFSSPDRIQLHAPYPNPAHRQATVRYETPNPTNVEIALYDLLRRRVQTVTHLQRIEGRHTASISTNALAPGTYFVRMEAGRQVLTRRLTIMR